jgi:hypothetical protein
MMQGTHTPGHGLEKQAMVSNARYRPWALALLVLAGCARGPQGAVEPIQSAQAAADGAMPVATVRAHVRGSFANAPDRGELIAYPSREVRRDGAYTWHRTGLSEAYALRAIADGHLRVTTPSGQLLDFKYDRHIEHPSGDWTWIGHLPGHAELQSIVTFGAHAAFGSIAQPDKLPLRLTMRDGASWLVETDGAKVAGIINAATRPQRPDFFIPPSSHRGATGTAPAMASAQATAAAGTATANTVDLVIGYTQGFAAANGGTSGAVTRLNYLVDVANAAYTNSGIPATARLVAAVPVTYTDTTSNDDALAKLTGYDANSNSSIPTDPAFNALRAAREQYGADLVSLVRTFNTPENGGCGIAWLIGGGQSGVAQSDSAFGYSVVSDGRDADTDGKTYFCLDETLAHELGHNMGAAHDVDTSKGDDGVLQADEYGAYPYSFGYKTAAGSGNFYTIMAYGDTGQTIYRIFSDPRSTMCGGRPCGTTTQADNARTLTQTIPIIATFRATVAPNAGTTAADDFNGDGTSDILWRNSASGANAIWRSADVALRQDVAQVADPNWKVVGAGDFDGDGKVDILWRNAATGSNAIWKSGNSATPQAITAVTSLSWKVAGVGDFNGDGKADILWRNAASGGNAIWLSGVYATQQAVDTIADANWVVAAVADFDGDGSADILWRNTATGANTIWGAGKLSLRRAVATVADVNWKVVGAGDFNGDGAADVLWRNVADGTNAIWRSANVNTRQVVTTVTGNAWSVASVGDFNGDGKADILWRNLSTGADTIWLAGNSGTSQAVATVADLTWQVVP